jgi:hypothetical protein
MPVPMFMTRSRYCEEDGCVRACVRGWVGAQLSLGILIIHMRARASSFICLCVWMWMYPTRCCGGGGVIASFSSSSGRSTVGARERQE